MHGWTDLTFLKTYDKNILPEILVDWDQWNPCWEDLWEVPWIEEYPCIVPPPPPCWSYAFLSVIMDYNMPGYYDRGKIVVNIAY